MGVIGPSAPASPRWPQRFRAPYRTITAAPSTAPSTFRTRHLRTITLTDIARTVGSVGQDIDAQMVASVVEDELLFGLKNFGVPREQIEARLD